jgi:hypothetical protein
MCTPADGANRQGFPNDMVITPSAMCSSENEWLETRTESSPVIYHHNRLKSKIMRA